VAASGLSLNGLVFSPGPLAMSLRVRRPRVVAALIVGWACFGLVPLTGSGWVHLPGVPARAVGAFCGVAGVAGLLAFGLLARRCAVGPAPRRSPPPAAQVAKATSRRRCPRPLTPGRGAGLLDCGRRRPPAHFLSGATTGTSNVAGATLPPFHASNDSRTFALPSAAPAGARTGP
jgi:hypothetical protein